MALLSGKDASAFDATLDLALDTARLDRYCPFSRFRFRLGGGVALPGHPQSFRERNSGLPTRGGQHLIQKGDLAKAREQLSEVLKLSPKDPNALNLMGVIEAQEGNYRAAEADFQKALGAAPRLTGAYLNLGHLYQEQAAKDPQAMKKGLETYRRLLRYEPENVEAHYQTAYLLMRLGSFHPSLEHLARLPPAAQARAQALSLKCADYSGLQDRAQADAAGDELAQSADLSEADVTSIAPLLKKHQREDLEIKLLGALEERNLASPGSLFQLGRSAREAGELPASPRRAGKGRAARPRLRSPADRAGAGGGETEREQSRTRLPGSRARFAA